MKTKMASNRGRRKCDIVMREIEEEKRLVEAARNGDLEEATTLLESGVSCDATEYNKHLFYKSENYMTPLQFATANGFPELVKLFIEYEADVDAKDRFDVTALHMAAEKGHHKCVKMLLDGGADCNISTKYSKHGSYTAVPHPGGTTPLHLAASNNHVDCVKLLIWNGADYNAVDERVRTSLYIAAQEGYDQCVFAHLDNAIWKDILSLPVKDSGDTPLHECVRRNMMDCISALLKRGSDVNHKNSAGFSPLHLAVRARDKFSMDTLKALVTKGYNTDVNMADDMGFYPLHYVCFNEASMQDRRPEAAALLLAYGANFNICNKQGDNVLQHELRSRNSDMLIIHTIAKRTAHLPSLETLGMAFMNSNPVNLFQRHQHQHPPEALRNLLRIHSDNQFAKYTWYRDLLKEPRSLQHYCRCVIREAMDVQRLRKIDCLPLPTTLKEFLLLEHEEFR